MPTEWQTAKDYRRTLVHLKAVEGITNSVDPDHAAPSGSAVLAQACLFQYLRLLRNLKSLCLLFRLPHFTREDLLPLDCSSLVCGLGSRKYT